VSLARAAPPGGIAGGHPQAQTDCSICHLDPQTQEPNLQGLHGFNCLLCHPSGFGGTILGPIGTWGGDCTECHNPCVPQTQSFTPTKGHRCVVCHGEQVTPTSITAMHREHSRAANCVVCHGFIPDMGTEIGSGNRMICGRCHEGGENFTTPHQEFHHEHANRGVSCLECHGDERPPVDVVEGPPVGSSTNVCEVCHTNQQPGDFQGNFEELHEEHIDKRMDCGTCHMQANLQDDRDPMPSLDDPVRAMVDRSGMNECFFCHEDGTGDSFAGIDIDDIHEEHVAGDWQWCYNCHEGDDVRPIGLAPPITTPQESCAMCHGSQTYDDDEPFDVHDEHAKRNKCYACHQATPPLFDWPESWYDETCCDGDLTGDGQVNGDDLGLLLGNWGQSGLGDIDGNGAVDGRDLGVLLGAWGACS
jgi:hypothetical protein